ncbi:MAG: aminodeoxychorismate/anthranilate synthase component II [Alphaproteobacteria bacterium]|nr:aminodeoxychorismate/anthranilate synthase component II [Alphaproteobacteria bacterium]
MILLIDNYDSFVHNLARYVGELGHERCVIRNDAINVGEIGARSPQAIIISPGPCRPAQAGVSGEIVRQLGTHIPILGVCLGHQVIAECFGGVVRRSFKPQHGKASLVRHNGAGIFAGLPNPVRAGRYHSLAVDIPSGGPLEVTASADDGEIMGLAHHALPVYGVQFHPESILTESGHELLGNFLRIAAQWNAGHARGAA